MPRKRVPNGEEGGCALFRSVIPFQSIFFLSRLSTLAASPQLLLSRVIELKFRRYRLHLPSPSLDARRDQRQSVCWG